MYILLSLMIFGPCGRGAKVGNKWNNKSSDTIFWTVPHLDPLVWMGVDSNNCFYINLGNFTVSAKWRLHLWGKIEVLPTYTIYIWVFTIPCTLIPDLFLGFYLTLIFFIPFIMFSYWMVHLHSIKFTFHLVIGAPPPILDIYVNIFLWFLDSPVFKIVNFLKTTIVGVS